MFVTLNAYVTPKYISLYFSYPLLYLTSCFVLSYELNKLRGKYIFQDEKLTFIYKTETILCKNMLVMSFGFYFS